MPANGRNTPEEMTTMTRHTKALTTQRPQRAQQTNFQVKLEAAYTTFILVMNMVFGIFSYPGGGDNDNDNNNDNDIN